MSTSFADVGPVSRPLASCKPARSFSFSLFCTFALFLHQLYIFIVHLFSMIEQQQVLYWFNNIDIEYYMLNLLPSLGQLLSLSPSDGPLIEERMFG